MDDAYCLSSSNTLLLNLLMREYNNWYFFNIIPKYDDNLNCFMRSCTDSEFLRFDLKQSNKILYFSIHQQERFSQLKALN